MLDARWQIPVWETSEQLWPEFPHILQGQLMAAEPAESSSNLCGFYWGQFSQVTHYVRSRDEMTIDVNARTGHDPLSSVN